MSGKSLRWLVRGAENLPRGSLSKEELIDLLAQDVMTGEAEVAREGGTWRMLMEHPDFRGIFLPGTMQNKAFEAQAQSVRSTRRSSKTRHRGRLITAGLLMVGSVGLAIFSTTTGLLTIPEPIVEKISGWFGSVSTQVGNNVDFSRETNPDAIQRSLPGEELFGLLPPLARDEPLPILLQTGWAAWWSGTDAGTLEARIAFESAVVRAPDDLEALGALVEVYSEMVAGEPDLKDAMTFALVRMSALDGEALATLRARAADAHSAGSDPLVVGILASCGSPISGLYDTVDLGCAVRLAEARGDDKALAAIQERTGSPRVTIIRARTAVAQENWGVAHRLSLELVQTLPGEASPFVTLAISSAAIGDWRSAESASVEAIRRAPHRLDLIHLQAKLQLRALDREADALVGLQSLIDAPRFEQYPERISVLNDAAEAAIAVGRSSVGHRLTERALALDGTNSVALLQQAWLRFLDGDTAGAEESLRRVDAGQLEGESGARIHLGVARVYLAMDNQRSATSEIESALGHSSTQVEAALEGALADTRISNLDAAVEKVTRAPLSDVVYARNLSPLAAVWTPPADLERLKNELGAALSNDVRYSIRLKEIHAIIDWFAGQSTAETSLRTALEEGGTPGASAALAQELFASNRPGEALKYVDAVLASEANNTIFLAMRGYAQAVRGEPAASQSIGRALSLEPSNPVVLHWSASASEALGDKAEAVSTLETLIEVSPDDVVTQARLISLTAE
ncbi:MAG: tetratricopeptide (TPR) repeat protein [Myxococcota bacterium]